MSKEKHISSNSPTDKRLHLKTFTQKVLQAAENGEVFKLDNVQSLSLLKELSSVIDQLSDLERNLFDSIYTGYTDKQTEPIDLASVKQSESNNLLSLSSIKIKIKPSSSAKPSSSTGTSIMNLSDSSKQGIRNSHIKIVSITPSD